MRPSRENEIFQLIALGRDGLTWNELLQRFPKQTLARNLKTLMNKGLIERIREPEKGRRGRPCTRYMIPGDVELCVSLPVRRLGSAWFVGLKVVRLGKETVRLLPEEKGKYDELQTWLKKRANGSPSTSQLAPGRMLIVRC